jgi:PucR-like helix-turn-helix protein
VPLNAIQQVIDELGARLQRSVVVADPNVKLLYATRHYGDEDEVRRRAVLQRDAGEEAIGYVLSQGVANWRTSGIIPANGQLALHARVCAPVRWRGALLGLLMVVDREGTLTTAELSMITKAAADLATLMLEEHPAEVDHKARVLSDALDDLVATEPALRRAAVRTLTTSLGDHADRHVRMVRLAAIQGPEPTSPGHISAGFEHALASGGSRPFAWTLVSSVHEQSALVLITSRTEIRDETITGYAGELVARVHAVAAGRFTCVAAVGGAGVGLEKARASNRQAELAAIAGRSLPARTVVRFADLGELAILLQLPLPQFDEDCLPDEVQRLLAYDKDGRTVETVRAFLDHAGSAPDTADALHVHRTTLYYRLERLREATDLDLDDGRTRLTVHLGLRLHELLQLHDR